MCVGIAEVSDYCLEYSKKSKDCSGKATLRRTQEEGHRAFGVVFEIPKTEREKLDEAEGTKHGGYKRWDCFPVRLLDSGQYLMTSCYLANKTDELLKPYNWYLALVIAGAIQHGFDREYIDLLKQTDYDVDSCCDRRTRRKAMEALGSAGFDNWRDLLTGKR